ncbi:unnamed protein product [Cyclocybe aegerita]|uniref:Uncharacterized protein n=1 Tax=Cyclocybe aegerita TaxID=1973307 RepID=A0A8S0WC55_CYCAE|nr:unnamed protein product [Cyclocybe aegerita]
MAHNGPPDAAAVEAALSLKEEPERMLPEIEKKLDDIAIKIRDLKLAQAKLSEEAQTQQATLNGCWREFYATLDILPWSQLTTVALSEGLSILDWVRIMELCGQMTKGTFFVQNSHPHDLTLMKGQPKRTHANLEILTVSLGTVRTHAPIPIVRLLSLFDFRKLRHLHISHVRVTSMYGDKPAGTFAEFSNLEYLSLGGSTPVANILDILHETANIRTFKFRANPDTSADSSATFKAVSFLESTILLPKLATLEIALRGLRPEEDMNLLVRMVESRCIRVPSGCVLLQHLVLESAVTEILQELEKRLEPCRTAGLKISSI